VDDKGNEFLGEVVNGKIFEGKGEIKYASDGSYYRGDFKGGLKHGRGEIVYSNGDKFSGEWANDMKHGYGKMELVSSGMVYYG
jgi:hypothetical protein